MLILIAELFDAEPAQVERYDLKTSSRVMVARWFKREEREIIEGLEWCIIVYSREI